MLYLNRQNKIKRAFSFESALKYLVYLRNSLTSGVFPASLEYNPARFFINTASFQDISASRQKQPLSALSY